MCQAAVSVYTIYNIFVNCLFQITMKEPQSIDDPAAIAFLTISRSPGGQGEVRMIWILEEAARYDITPLNGTVLFTEVHSLLSSISFLLSFLGMN